MNKLRNMQTFILAVEKGSITAAAKHLRISKAAASKQLIDLENEVNTKLLIRTTRMLQLTDTGILYYEALKKVFLAVDEAECIVTESHAKPTGILRVASHRHFGEKFIVNHLKEFLTLYPDLILDLELGDRFPDIEKENFDILCGVGSEGPDHLIRKRIATVHHILCAAPSYLNQFNNPKTPDDLKKHRFITHSFRNPDNILLFKNGKEVYVDFYLRLNDAQAMLQCALQGLGIIKIYNYFVDEHIKKGNLVEILRDFREPPKYIYLFYQPRKFMPAKIRVCIDFITKKVNEDKRLLANVNMKDTMQ